MIFKRHGEDLRPLLSQKAKPTVEDTCKVCGDVYDLEPGDIKASPHPPLDFGGQDGIWVCPNCGASNRIKVMMLPNELKP